MTDMISREAAIAGMERLGASGDLGVRVCMEHAAKAIAALPAQPAQGVAVALLQEAVNAAEAYLADDMPATSFGVWLSRSKETIAAHPTTPPDSAELDADLLLDAYKAVLVLHRMLDKQGLEMGVKAANEIADRIVKAHPEFPGLTALRAKGVR